MTWTTQAAHSLTDALSGSFDSDGVVVAAAAVDGSEAVTEGGPADGRFEIGSVTKTMTATLLASLAGDGVVELDGEIGRWLEAGPNASVTLRELATHTSGLPRLAPNHQAARDKANPYAHYTPGLAEEGLRQAPRTPDAGFAYSNFGYQMLGLALERATGSTYQELLSKRILVPLSMTSSGVGPAGGGTRLPGHAEGKTVPHWDFPLPGPGGVEATIGDLARYLQAGLAPPDTALGAAIRLTQTPQLRVDERREIALGWIIRDGRVLWHNGGTGGFAASLAIDRVERCALAILASTHGKATGILDTAVLLALSGGDPRGARPQRHEQPRTQEPAWDERAREMASALLAGRFAEAYENFAPQSRARLSVEQLQHGWQRATSDAGDPGQVSVSCQPVGTGVGALVTIACTQRTLSLAIVFDPSGRVTGLRPLRPGEAPPW